MHLVLMVGILLAALLCEDLTAAILRSPPRRATAIATGVQISPEVIQLASIGGRVPVEIQNVRVQSKKIDLAVFTDNTSRGPNVKGSIYIYKVREGALSVVFAYMNHPPSVNF
ncbi:MAG: hypothetical protein L0226_15320 [Acidobacteria bacterium]|nr:hypothetical protein [Acidobacteriota bacterium]